MEFPCDFPRQKVRMGWDKTSNRKHQKENNAEMWQIPVYALPPGPIPGGCFVRKLCLHGFWSQARVGDFLLDSEGIQQIFAEQQIFVVPGPAMCTGDWR